MTAELSELDRFSDPEGGDRLDGVSELDEDNEAEKLVGSK